jgi:predicted glycosyltransferase
VRSDFAALLAAGALSISQCGYNTMMDVLRAGIRAVVVPFAGDGETEQTMRADIWAARGGVHVVSEHDLSPATLAVAVNHAADSAPTAISGLNFDGANNAANFIKEVASARACSR